jgi:hypothetical protein
VQQGGKGDDGQGDDEYCEVVTPPAPPDLDPDPHDGSQPAAQGGTPRKRLRTHTEPMRPSEDGADSGGGKLDLGPDLALSNENRASGSEEESEKSEEEESESETEKSEESEEEEEEEEEETELACAGRKRRRIISSSEEEEEVEVDEDEDEEKVEEQEEEEVEMVREDEEEEEEEGTPDLPLRSGYHKRQPLRNEQRNRWVFTTGRWRRRYRPVARVA